MHLEVEAVDQVVVGDHHARQLDVLLADRLPRPVDRLRHELEPTEGLVLELLHLVLEMQPVPELVDHHPTFPVTYASIRPVEIGSSAEHGSSIRITSGSMARQRAMQRRCCCPPDIPKAFDLRRS